MFRVDTPESFNDTWARAFNTRQMDNILSLYEDDAILADPTRFARGKTAIAELLQGFMGVPGTIQGRNSFCLQLDDLALLRADWKLTAPDGTIAVAGSSAEIIRRQPDGRWLYVIDHAAGSSIPAVI
jgi:ketosteroid isomerase-like protein